MEEDTRIVTDEKRGHSNQLCRICYSTSDEEPLITPCKCSGTMKYIHQSCLMTWLKSGSKQCEICKESYRFRKYVRHYADVSKKIIFVLSHQPDNIYLFRVNNRRIRKRCEICSELTIKTPERLHWLW